MQLSQKEAEQRFLHVKTNIKYQTFLNISKGDVYSGSILIRFNMKEINNTFLDYNGNKLLSMEVNEHRLEAD